MDSLITAAAQCLMRGDPLSALNWVALRDDPPALALRGIAMARLGDTARATGLLRKAARGFGPRQPVASARCAVAEAEIALVSRELNWPLERLQAARVALEKNGDRPNANYARQLEARRLLLLGRVDEAEASLNLIDTRWFSPALTCMHQLIAASIALRQLHIARAKAALAEAQIAARHAQIAALDAEVAKVTRLLTSPAAQLLVKGDARTVLLEEVAAIWTSDVLAVDGCRYQLTHQNRRLSLASRPVLFQLLSVLAESWPYDASRALLIERVFRTLTGDESHRARLRVEIGRLRAEVSDFADIIATSNGFQLIPKNAAELVVLLPPVEEKSAPILALLADGESWSSSALALALEASPRTVQRALEVLAERGKVKAFGRGRARRWASTELPGFTTLLLLPGPLPTD